MSNRVSAYPKYRLHKQSGQAIVTLPDGAGGRKDFLLGEHGSEESKREYRRRLAEWEATGKRLLPVKDAKNDLTVFELADLFWTHAEQHYRRADGTTTYELEEFKQTLRPFTRLYGDTLAKDFGPLALEAVRKAMVTGSWLTEEEKAQRQKAGKKVDWCRTLVNKRVARVRRMFRWAVAKELIPAEKAQALSTLSGLQRGRTNARETEPVKPVAIGWVEATLPYMSSEVQDMVRLQLHSGARPGEVCAMRAIDLDMNGNVWLYRPAHHKTTHQDFERVIALGPKCQDIIRRRLTTDLHAHLFSPARAVADKCVRQRKQRKTRVQPSQHDRRKAKPKKAPGDHYTTDAYGYAVRKACAKADKAAREMGLAGVPAWHPHQLRHTAGTRVRKEFGMDAARTYLGHQSPTVTAIYAEADTAKAVEVAAKLG